MSSWKVEGIRGDGAEDDVLSRLRGQGRGLQGMGGTTSGVSTGLGNLEEAGAVACVGSWLLTRHELCLSQVLALLTCNRPGTTSLSQVQPSLGLRCCVTTKVSGMKARCCLWSRLMEPHALLGAGVTESLRASVLTCPNPA